MVWSSPDHRSLLAFKTGEDGPGPMLTLRCQELFEKDKLTTDKPELGFFCNVRVQLVQLQCPGQRLDIEIYWQRLPCIFPTPLAGTLGSYPTPSLPPLQKERPRRGPDCGPLSFGDNRDVLSCGSSTCQSI